jgi:hypothetical protein
MRYTKLRYVLRSFASVHNLRYTKVPLRPSVLSFHLFILRYTRVRSPPCYHSHLFINLRYTRVPFRPSVLSFASVHKFALHEGCRYVPPCYHSHLFINLRCYEGHVPPCYHSHLFIIALRRVPISRPSVLSFASVHKICVTRRCRYVLRAIIRICS